MLRRALEAEPIDQGAVESGLLRAQSDAVELDTANLTFVVATRMAHAMQALRRAPESTNALEDAIAVARAVRLLPFEVNIWQAQNLWHSVWKHARAKGLVLPDEARFFDLGKLLSIAPAQLTAEEGV